MKAFTKQSLTKRMLAIILSLLFAVSSFTIAGFSPVMQADAEVTNIAGSASISHTNYDGNFANIIRDGRIGYDSNSSSYYENSKRGINNTNSWTGKENSNRWCYAKFSWDTAKNISSANVYFWVDSGGTKMPNSFKIRYSEDGVSYTEITYNNFTSSTSGHVSEENYLPNKNHYSASVRSTFNLSSISKKSIKYIEFVSQQQGTAAVGLSEIEIYGQDVPAGYTVTPDPDINYTVPGVDVPAALNVSSLESEISTFETSFYNKISSSTTPVKPTNNNWADCYKVYIKAKAVLDSVKYGAEKNTYSQSDVDSLYTDLRNKNNIISSVQVITKSQRNLSAPNKIFNISSGTQIPNSKTISSSSDSQSYNYNTAQNSSYYKNTIFVNGGDRETPDTSISTGVNTTDSGKFTFMIPEVTGVYDGTSPVEFPVLFNHEVGNVSKNFNYIVVAESRDYQANPNTVQFGKWWIIPYSVCDNANYGWIMNNGSFFARGDAQETPSNVNSNFKNVTKSFYANTLQITPNDSNYIAEVVNFGINISPANHSGSRTVSNNNLKIRIFNYKKYQKDTKTYWDSLKDIVTKEKVAGNDIDHELVLNYLIAFDKVANFDPYGVNSSYDASLSNFNNGVTYINELSTAASRVATNDKSFNTLRTTILEKAQYTKNTECYNYFDEYLAARADALQAITAASKNTSNNYLYSTTSNAKSISTIATNLVNAYNKMINSDKVHTYGKGVRIEDNKVIVPCLANDSHDYAVVDASAYLIALNVLNIELQKTEKYTAESIEDVKSYNGYYNVINNTNNILIFNYSNLQNRVDEFTSYALELYNRLKDKNNLVKVNLHYSYEKNNTILASGTKENVTYGDIVADAPYTLKSGEIVSKWTAEVAGEGTRKLANTTNAINYSPTKEVWLTCYIEDDTNPVSNPCTLTFLTKSGRVAGIVVVEEGTELSFTSTQVIANDKVVFEAEPILFYAVRGYRIGGTTYESNGSTYTVTKDTNINTVYNAQTPITVTRGTGAGDVLINGKGSATVNVPATWDQKITITDEKAQSKYYYVNDVLMYYGGYANFSFRACNSHTVITATDNVPTNWQEHIVGLDYFDYDAPLNKVTAIVTFSQIAGINKETLGPASEAGVYLSTSVSDKTQIQNFGKKFKSSRFTDIGNQTMITVSRTATTAFHMYALPYVIINGVEYVGNVGTINYNC